MKLIFLIVFAMSFTAACSDSTKSDPPPVNMLPDKPDMAGGDMDDMSDMACEPETDEEMCARVGYTCGALSDNDNCGVARDVASCGAATVCAAYETCGALEPGQCGCVAETDEEVCTRLDIQCGPLEAVDNCESPRNISCGDESTVCLQFETCGGGGTPGQCGCMGETDAEFCAANQYECGELQGTDRCGVPRTVAGCGSSCVAPETCGGGGTPGQCACVAETDAEMCIRLAVTCGPLDDVDNCGTARTIASCGAIETDAEMCTRLAVDCGALDDVDNCGTARTIASCGDEAVVCGQMETCGGGGTPGVCGCTPVSDAELCTANGYVCGELMANDNCGAPRTVAACGSNCTGATTCGGGGTPGQCGCTPDTDANICTAATAECGDLTLIDNCDANRTANCGDEAVVCAGFDTCAGGGVENTCGCTPTTCDIERVLCGALDDGCGSTLLCDAFCVEEVVAGADHACAIGNERLKCWGRNTKGQIGDGTRTQRNNPVNIPGLAPVMGVGPGGSHTCVLVDNGLMNNTGTVLCWGDNSSGQLGVGTTVDNNSPGAAAAASATQIVSGVNHSCALIGGGVKCWGSNDYGKIGNSLLNIGANVAVANNVTGLSVDVVELSAGSDHTCALKTDGSVWCWGRNRFGQSAALPFDPLLPIDAFGYDNTGTIDAATLQNVPVQVVLPASATKLATGADHSCAVDINDEVWCWGSMTRASTAATTCPVETGYFSFNGDPIVKNGAVCSIFPSVLTNPALLGHPVTKYRTTVANGPTGCVPPPLPDLPIDCDTAGGYVCDTIQDRCIKTTYPITTVYVDYAALTPVKIGYSSAVDYLDSGANHLCAVVQEPNLLMSNVRCFGLNAFGQLGDGTNNNWPGPIELYLDTNGNVVRAPEVTGGDNFSCALVDDANVVCWGSNQYGQIGNSALLRDESYRPFDVKLNHEL